MLWDTILQAMGRPAIGITDISSDGHATQDQIPRKRGRSDCDPCIILERPALKAETIVLSAACQCDQ